jgi:hypothetical protein
VFREIKKNGSLIDPFSPTKSLTYVLHLFFSSLMRVVGKEKARLVDVDRSTSCRKNFKDELKKRKKELEAGTSKKGPRTRQQDNSKPGEDGEVPQVTTKYARRKKLNF